MSTYSQMHVEILSHTPDPERVVALAARLCYSPLSGEQLKAALTPEKVESLLEKVLGMGHFSVLEHVSFTFLIEGISRVTTHQLVRHRIGCSYSQKSQRYARETEPEFVVPPKIEKDPVKSEEFLKTCREAFSTYCDLVDWGVHQEEARYLLPQALESKIVVTMNGRALHHFFSLRCCTRAQGEIRTMARKMLKLVKEKAPLLFETAGAACERGPCPEGDKSCGRWRKKGEVNGNH